MRFATSLPGYHPRAHCRIYAPLPPPPAPAPALAAPQEEDLGFLAEPHVSDVAQVAAGEEAYVVIASDGLWDVVPEEKAGKMVLQVCVEWSRACACVGPVWPMGGCWLDQGAEDSGSLAAWASAKGSYPCGMRVGMGRPPWHSAMMPPAAGRPMHCAAARAAPHMCRCVADVSRTTPPAGGGQARGKPRHGAQRRSGGRHAAGPGADAAQQG